MKTVFLEILKLYYEEISNKTTLIIIIIFIIIIIKNIVIRCHIASKMNTLEYLTNPKYWRDILELTV